MLYRHEFNIEDMINHQLDQIPLHIWLSSTTTFCDMEVGGGQYIKAVIERLLKAGHSFENIHKRVFGYGRNSIELRCATKRLIGTFQVMSFEDILKGKINMKFDVIVGNPPYHMPGTPNKRFKLWDQFIAMAMKIVKPEGYIAYVTPASWMAPNEIFELMNTKKLVWVNTDVKKYFPGIGSTFSAWVMKNVSGDNTAIIDGHKIDWSIHGLIPIDHSPITMTIIDKLFNTKNKIQYKIIYTHQAFNGKKKGFISDERTEEFKYPIYHTNAQTLWSSKPHAMMGVKKVIVSYSGYWNPIYDEEMGTTQAVWIMPVKSKKQGQNLVGILNSKLFRFTLENTKYSGFYLKNVFDKFPAIDSSRAWTDAELYAHFKLTKAEIKYIEDNTKAL